MDRDDSWLLDMLIYAREACELIAGMSREQFLADRATQLAVTHLVMIVGEAAAQVTIGRRAAIPQIPWSIIVGTRNIIVHHYFKVDLNVIWNVVYADLPNLIPLLEAIVPSEDHETE
jgi:uncharacterized protein with HEPN domain